MNGSISTVGLSLLLWLHGGILHAEQSDRSKSVTVYPVVISPSDNIAASIPQRIAEVVGLQLERAGMERIEMGEAMFSPPDTKDVNELSAAFGRFVAQSNLQTEYAVFAQILGRPGAGISEIRTIVVDGKGKVVFNEWAGEEIFSTAKTKPQDPLTASLFVVERLGNVWQLSDPFRQDAPQGKMAELMRKRSGLPSDQELAAMNKRFETLKDKMASSTVSVYPVHLWSGSDRASGVELAKMLNDQGICRAEAVETDPRLEIKGDPNEQKILWDTARLFAEFLRNNPPATQFALLADYGLSVSSDAPREANHVHLILCDRAGQWVMVDFQNSHHTDFQSIAPKSRTDCNRLAAKRLRSRLSP